MGQSCNTVRLSQHFQETILSMIPSLPHAAVIIHFTQNSFSKGIEQKINSAVESCVEYESSSEGDRYEFVLEYTDWKTAVDMVHSLSGLTKNPNLLMLLAKSYTDESITPIIYKDHYRPHRVNHPSS